MKDENKFFLALFLAIIILSFLTIKTLISPLLIAAVLAYIAYPVYSWLKNRIKSESIAALTVTALIILLITVPTALLIKEFTGEMLYIYIELKKALAAVELSSCTPEGPLCSLVSLYQTFLSDPQLNLPLTNAVSKVAAHIVDSISNSLISLPKKFIEMFIIIFSTYYLFKDGSKIITKLEAILPLKKKHKEDLFSRVESAIKGTVYGNLMIAVMQGILAMAGFYLLGVQHPITLGLLTVFAALLPFIGAAIVWLPAALIMILDAALLQNDMMLFKGAALLIYGTLVISGIDNILKPKIISEKAKMHPLMVLLGVIGGIKLFGIAGFLIGPALLAVFVTFVEIYSEEKMLE